MKTIKIDLKKGKKKPDRIIISSNQIILVGNPPFTCLESDYTFLKDAFDISAEVKTLNEVEVEKEDKGDKGGKNG
jgi:predicted RNA methylase